MDFWKERRLEDVGGRSLYLVKIDIPKSLDKLNKTEVILLSLAAIGFFMTGRWLYHKLYPPEEYTIEVDI